MATILLVEDDPWMADCFRQWLAVDTHDIRHARDAQDALCELDGGEVQLLVLDLLLPYVSGVQLLHMMQSYKDLADIPVILCTNSLPPSAVDFTAYGVRSILDKQSVTPYTMRRVVKDVLRYASI